MHPIATRPAGAPQQSGKEHPLVLRFTMVTASFLLVTRKMIDTDEK